MAVLKFKSEGIANNSDFEKSNLVLEKSDKTKIEILPEKVYIKEGLNLEISIKDSDLNKFLNTDKIFLNTDGTQSELESIQFEDGNYISNADENTYAQIEKELLSYNTTPQDEQDSLCYDGSLTCWMDAMYYTLKDKLLTEIAIPGTHNSGVFSWKNTIAYRCQDKDINEQLNMGVRAFDIRFKKSGSGYYMHHNGAFCEEQSLTHLLDSLERYLNKYLKEVIIIDLTKGSGSNLSDDDFRYIKEKLAYSLGDFMYPSNIKSLTELKFNDLIESNKRLIVISEDIPLGDKRENLFWTNTKYIHNTWTSEQQEWTYTVEKKMDLLKIHIEKELNKWSSTRDRFVIYSFNIWSINIAHTCGIWENYYLNGYFDGTARAGMRIAVFDFIKENIVRGVIACNV